VRRTVLVLFALLALSLLRQEGARGQTWVQRVAGSGLGNPLCVNPLNPDILYGAAGTSRIFISRDQGYHWLEYGSIIPGSGIIKSVVVSPLDTMKILAGVEMSGGAADRVVRSTDGGVNWTDVWAGTFSYYGQPIEFIPEHPDTVFVMGSDTVWRSIDFGATWDTLSRAGFNTWCDMSVRPDSASILLVGDNMSGIWKSTTGGVTWTQKYATVGEIPSIAIDPFTPRTAYASKYGGGGGIVKTTNGGETWFALSVPSLNRDTWWVTCSKTQPGWVYYGTYTGDTSVAGIWCSRNSGATWQRYSGGLYPSGIINYGLVAVDSLTVVALQGVGIYKLQFPVAAHLLTPNGGEYFQGGAVRPISWTSSYLPIVKLQFSTNNGATWSLIADSLPPSASPYAWTVPAGVSSSCRIRVADARYSGAADASDAAFSIADSLILLSAPAASAAWTVGSVRQVAWSSPGVAAARLEFSTDAGASWEVVTDVSGAAGSYPWLIPSTPSASCRVRLTDLTDTLVRATSALFSIVERGDFRAALRVSDAGAGADTLLFGASGGATDGIDVAEGETELPGAPSPGQFDARWLVPPTAGTTTDIRDSLGEAHVQNVFTLAVQVGPGGYPLTLRWSPDSLGEGSFTLRDTLTRGLLAGADMRRESTLVVANASVTAFEIIQVRSVNVVLSGDGGWKLVSLPVVTADRRKSTLFPNSLSAAFAFSQGYAQRDTLSYGAGYWLKARTSYLVGGAMERDTLPVSAGWNIIGSLSVPVPSSAVRSLPESLVVSSIFGYANGYFAADTITPGEGYWVKVKSAGSLVLDVDAPPQAMVIRKRLPLNTLTIRDDRGGESILRFDGSMAVDRQAEMPPRPPNGAFDARFLEAADPVEPHENAPFAHVFPISVQSDANKIFFLWHVENEENFSYILTGIDGTRDVPPVRLTADGSTNFTHHKLSSYALKVQRNLGTNDLPDRFAMGELYPNPCNPSTQFRYIVPLDAHVTIEVYSVLGTLVATLLDGERPRGAHVQEWKGTDASGRTVSSGVYYVRMHAVSASGAVFTQVRSALVLK
jgi:hypothetical protein